MRAIALFALCSATLLSACNQTPSGPGGGGTHLTARLDGEPLLLWTQGEMPPGTVMYAITQAEEWPRLIPRRNGGTLIAVPASTDNRNWAGGFVMEIIWDLPHGSPDLETALMAAPYRSTISYAWTERVSRTQQQRHSFRSDSGDNPVTLESITGIADGFRIRGSYAGTLCKIYSEEELCHAIEGRFDVDIPDWRGRFADGPVVPIML